MGNECLDLEKYSVCLNVLRVKFQERFQLELRLISVLLGLIHSFIFSKSCGGLWWIQSPGA